MIRVPLRFRERRSYHFTDGLKSCLSYPLDAPVMIMVNPLRFFFTIIGASIYMIDRLYFPIQERIFLIMINSMFCGNLMNSFNRFLNLCILCLVYIRQRVQNYTQVNSFDFETSDMTLLSI